MGTALIALSGCASGGYYDDYDDYDDYGYYDEYQEPRGRYSLGLVIETLPRGYVSFRYGGSPHYFYDGRFYRRHRRGYVVVAPPRGAHLRRLPRGARSYRRGNAEYKEYRGVVYERARKGRRDGYRVKGRTERRDGQRSPRRGGRRR
ncbi:MAG: DUF6515 family protein [Longimicrobiales bacterium]